jgi:hypothetical protein
MVVISMRQKVDLVSADYYAKELNYQSDINKMANAKALKTPLKCSLVNNTVQLIFPEEHAEKSIEAKAFVYKPSDNKSDKEIKFTTEDGRYVLSTEGFVKGMYKIKVDWKVDNIEYQTETVIVL